ncbi:hypothetical protein GCM10025867_15570 [Frondihabitans sucicola]|uniref:Uncharacterized protein n=1 Tax=Frondihabitans sucicola TaxID=1268041 RepID=A0ABM8GLR8_9MICO|nr:hypothetical protein [Frondihabitans sucicola]BDZ49316.1 hypothetical protein GCM10025867_15570 [Frondihabitans sucicola]
MASALDLAGTVRGLEPEALLARLRERTVNRPASVKDAFDLADALLDHTSVRDALTRLDRVALLALRVAATTGTPADLLAAAAPSFDVAPDEFERALSHLDELFLVFRAEGTTTTFGPVTTVLDDDPALSQSSLGGTTPPSSSRPSTPSTVRPKTNGAPSASTRS